MRVSSIVLASVVQHPLIMIDAALALPRRHAVAGIFGNCVWHVARTCVTALASHGLHAVSDVATPGEGRGGYSKGERSRPQLSSPRGGYHT